LRECRHGLSDALPRRFDARSLGAQFLSHFKSFEPQPKCERRAEIGIERGRSDSRRGSKPVILIHDTTEPKLW
jgi:hypothetical protein